MKILITGRGGREQALKWKFEQSPKVTAVFLLPQEVEEENLVNWVKSNYIDLVIVSTDNHLAAGWVDILTAAQIKTFGPSKVAAEIEWSKSFAKNLMLKAGVPTAKFKTFTDLNLALAYIKN